MCSPRSLWPRPSRRLGLPWIGPTRAGILVGSAPDTFLGSAAQSARAAIDAGDIGDVNAVVAFAPYNRAERRHPNPEFLFAPGAGPLLDVAPYHISWLIHLLGPVETVAGMSRRSGSSRAITTVDGRHIEIPVTVDTHVTSLLAFASGVVGTFITSFDIWSNRLPSIEIYGSTRNHEPPPPQLVRRRRCVSGCTTITTGGYSPNCFLNSNSTR